MTIEISQSQINDTIEFIEELSRRDELSQLWMIEDEKNCRNKYEKNCIDFIRTYYIN